MKKTQGNPVVHFEIGCANKEDTSRFYQSVFNWNITDIGISSSVDTGAGSGINGHITALGHEPFQYIKIYIEVADVEKHLQLVEQNGGKRKIGPLPLPDGRFFAWCEDVAGNTIGLISPLL